MCRLMHFYVDTGPVTRERARIFKQAVLDTIRHLLEMPDDQLQMMGVALMRSVEQMKTECVIWEAT